MSIMTNTKGTPISMFTMQDTQEILNDIVIIDAAITRAKLSDNILSDNYITGLFDWRISLKYSNSEFNNVLSEESICKK
ncbi:MAG: phage tail tip fiber protein [Candidatus Malihini olakiniferum]